jgi:hypothetical protein
MGSPMHPLELTRSILDYRLSVAAKVAIQLTRLADRPVTPRWEA